MILLCDLLALGSTLHIHALEFFRPATISAKEQEVMIRLIH